MGIFCPDGRTLVLYYGKSLDLARRYALEEDGVLRDKETAWFKNLVYTAAVGVLRYRRIGIELAAAAATSAATAAAELEKAQLLRHDFPLNTMMDELASWAEGLEAERLEAERLEGGE